MVTKTHTISLGAVVAVIVLFSGVYFLMTSDAGSVTYIREGAVIASSSGEVAQTQGEVPVVPAWPLSLDTTEYDKRILALADYKPETTITSMTASGTPTTTVIATPLVYSSTTNIMIKDKRWPASAVYPQGGAILPFKRILAYYGNFYSKHMGILGEYSPDEVVRRLAETKKLWETADPNTPVLEAIEYIAMVAQADAGADGMYRAMMPAVEIEKAYTLAKKIDGILILDLQIGLSSLSKELPKFETYLMRPEVHLALDPEFSMKSGDKPGTVIGTFDAKDINYTIDYMSDIVRAHKLPPKVLLVHRFTDNMVTNATLITPTPEVQVVMVMDGWGPKENKRGTYSRVIEPEPVQFAGIKMFYKNDLKTPSTGLLTPAEVLSLHPKPIYIQYQ